MKPFRNIAVPILLGGASLWWLCAAQEPATPAPATPAPATPAPVAPIPAPTAPAPVTTAPAASVYNEHRSFAQPVRPDPVGTKISGNRAFWGAPPPMPHSFPEARDDGRLCLGCHARENRIEKRQQAIVPVPHAEFSQCQQCHVPKGDGSSFFRASGFVGLDYPGKGTRAHIKAPPTIPHKTYMRDNCLSCHGPAGKQKIASPHPFRSQCQQCHLSDATKNYDRPVPWKTLDGKL